MFFVAQGCSSLPLKAVYKYRSRLFIKYRSGLFRPCVGKIVDVYVVA
jgi:hypothetical protein